MLHHPVGDPGDVLPIECCIMGVDIGKGARYGVWLVGVSALRNTLEGPLLVDIISMMCSMRFYHVAAGG